MKIVITGSSGFIGSRLASAFWKKGDTVIGIDAREPRSPVVEQFVKAGIGKALDSEIFRGADLVIHCAHDMRPGQTTLNIKGTQAWTELARNSGAVGQLFLTSASAGADAPSEYGQAKYELEQYFLGKGQWVVRPGLVAGPGGSFGSMVQMMKKLPVGVIPGGNDIKLILTDIETLTKTILYFKSLKKGQVYNLFQPEKTGFLDFYRQVKEVYRLKGVWISLPLGPSKALLKLAEMARFPMPASLNYASFCALEKSQHYGYVSCYPELGLRSKTIRELLEL